MIDTYSKFYYGLEVTASNKWIDFDEGAGEINVSLDAGFYTLEQIAQAVEDEMNSAGTDVYTVTVNRDTRKITIASTGTFDLLWNSGVNNANTIGTLIGFVVSADDTTLTTITSDNAIGSVYEPQFKLQDYVSEADFRNLRSATRNKSASGLIEVINFGTEKFFEFSIKFATNIPQPASGPIINNTSGVANLEAFMQYMMQGAAIEFMPNKDDETTYYTLFLESTSSEGSGMGYKLQEQYGRGLKGYFETGMLKFRYYEG